MRRNHPDARDAPGALLVGGADIVRLNEAWRVLRDPALRHRYDASLRPAPAVPLRFDDREGWGEIFDPVYAPVPRRPRPSVVRGSLAGRVPRRVLLVVGVLVALAAIVVFTAYASGGSSSGASGTAPSAAPVGSCITIPVGQVAKVVPCGQTNDGIVVAPVAATATCPRGAVARALEPGGWPDVCLVPR